MTALFIKFIFIIFEIYNHRLTIFFYLFYEFRDNEISFKLYLEHIIGVFLLIVEIYDKF